jgi:hypothetical protein
MQLGRGGNTPLPGSGIDVLVSESNATNWKEVIQ